MENENRSGQAWVVVFGVVGWVYRPVIVASRGVRAREYPMRNDATAPVESEDDHR